MRYQPKSLLPAATAVLIAGLALLLTGCGTGDLTWKTTNLTGVMPDLAFTLTSEEGRTVQASDYGSKVRLLFFGFTHCPDICPTTLAVTTQALGRLGEQADAVRVLFVSVDPKRDSPRHLGRYTAAFGPRVIGLTGTQAQLKELAKRYRVGYRYGETDAQGNYPVYHSSGIFVFDREGEIRLLMGADDGAKAIAHDLRQLVEQD